MEYTIKNENLIVVTTTYGAELQSIKKKDDNVEYLWQFNPDIWERQAPLLFPIIGRLKDEEYEYKNKIYKIAIHGFANTTEFEVFDKKEDSITFLLKANEETLKVYPFKFELYINFALEGNKIVKNHLVKNLTDGDMYYEIGGHEGFNLALFDDEKMEDYYFEFPKMNKLETYTADSNVMMNKAKREVELNKSKLFLHPSVFKNDALIMDEFATNQIKLENKKNDRSVIVDFNDFKYLGIWTKPFRTNYVCIEPWSSLPDCNYLDKKLINKQDVVKLGKDESKKMTYTITII